MSQACIEWQGEIGAYIVGALGRDAAATVNGHLMRCTGCRAEYDNLAPLRIMLDTLTDSADWTRDCAADACAAISTDASTPPATTRPRRRRQPPRTRPPRTGYGMAPPR